MITNQWHKDMEAKRKRANRAKLARFGGRSIERQEAEWRKWAKESRARLVREYVAAGIVDYSDRTGITALDYLQRGA